MKVFYKIYYIHTPGEQAVTRMSTGESQPVPGFRPLYAQVRELFVRRLADGEWRAGELLPSEPRLAAELGVSQGTVRKALDELTAQNLLVRRQGKGTFVASYTPDRALFRFFHLVGDDGARKLPESRVVARRSAGASAAERERLGLAARARVLRIERVRCLDGAPVIAERISVPVALFPGLADLAPGALPNTLYALYETRWGLSVARAVERLRAVAAGAADARLLGVARGAPLLEIDRTALGHAGTPLEWRRSRCDTRRHHYLNALE